VHEAYQTLINPERKAFYDVQLGVYNVPPVYTTTSHKHRSSVPQHKTPAPSASRHHASAGSSTVPPSSSAAASASVPSAKAAPPPTAYRTPSPVSTNAAAPSQASSQQASHASTQQARVKEPLKEAAPKAIPTPIPPSVPPPPATSIEPLSQLQHWFNQLRGATSPKDPKADLLSKDGDDLTVALTLNQEEAKKPCLKKVVLEKMAPCSDCAGTGRLSGRVCTACNGTGERHWTRKLEVQLPGGVKTGSKVRVAGEGHPGLGQGKPGDLYIKLEVMQPLPAPITETPPTVTPTSVKPQEKAPSSSMQSGSAVPTSPSAVTPAPASAVVSGAQEERDTSPLSNDSAVNLPLNETINKDKATLSENLSPSHASSAVYTPASSSNTGAYSATYVEALQQLSVEGRNVHLNWHLEVHSAVLGDTITVPTLNGPVALVIPAGTQHGQTFRLKGQGLKEENELPAGDQKVTLLLKIPKVLNVEEKALYEALRKLSSPG
jgi:DnaJ C terminal domain